MMGPSDDWTNFGIFWVTTSELCKNMVHVRGVCLIPERSKCSLNWIPLSYLPQSPFSPTGNHENLQFGASNPCISENRPVIGQPLSQIGWKTSFSHIFPMSWWASIWVNPPFRHPSLIFSLKCPIHSHTNSPLYRHVRLFSNVWFFKSAVETQKEHMLWVIYPTQNSYCSFPKQKKEAIPKFRWFHHVFIMFQPPSFTWFSHPTSTAFKASKAPQTRSTPLPTFRCVASRLLEHERLAHERRWDWKMMKLLVKYKKKRVCTAKKDCYCIDI